MGTSADWERVVMGREKRIASDWGWGSYISESSVMGNIRFNSIISYSLSYKVRRRFAIRPEIQSRQNHSHVAQHRRSKAPPPHPPPPISQSDKVRGIFFFLFFAQILAMISLTAVFLATSFTWAGIWNMNWMKRKEWSNWSFFFSSFSDIM